MIGPLDDLDDDPAMPAAALTTTATRATPRSLSLTEPEPES